MLYTQIEGKNSQKYGRMHNILKERKNIEGRSVEREK